MAEERGHSRMIKYINEKEVSRIIGRAVQTLRNDRHLGRGIAYYKNGKSVRYKIEDVLKYMETRRIETDDIK